MTAIYNTESMERFWANNSTNRESQSARGTRQLQNDWLAVYATEARAALHRWPDMYDWETLLYGLIRYDFRISARKYRAEKEYAALPAPQKYVVLFTVPDLGAIACEGQLLPANLSLELTEYAYNPTSPFVGPVLIVAAADYKWTALMTRKLGGPFFKWRSE